ncbi:MAG: phosphopantetheine adenylyltransferase [Alphaproteobacteria bacterium]|nr:phosphopantetheine adenylyltransferase [Alphaproteobacteria bacterium]
MRNKLVRVAIIGAGIMNLLPIVGVLSAERLSQAYGIDVSGPDLEILLRHRAVLFGLLGTFMIYGAFKEELQTLAIIGGLVSMGAFIGLGLTVGGYGAALEPLILADAIGCVVLLFAVGLRWLGQREGRDKV